MFKKCRIKRKINKIIKQIEKIERERARSQGALVQAILTHESPNDEDVDYFNQYTAQIDELRKHLTKYKEQLANLSK